MVGLLFGIFGFHNFYAGRYVIGLLRLLLVTLALAMDIGTGLRTGFSVVIGALSGLAALLEIILVDTDSDGQKMT